MSSVSSIRIALKCSWVRLKIGLGTGLAFPLMLKQTTRLLLYMLLQVRTPSIVLRPPKLPSLVFIPSLQVSRLRTRQPRNRIVSMMMCRSACRRRLSPTRPCPSCRCRPPQPRRGILRSVFRLPSIMHVIHPSLCLLLSTLRDLIVLSVVVPSHRVDCAQCGTTDVLPYSAEGLKCTSA